MPLSPVPQRTRLMPSHRGLHFKGAACYYYYNYFPTTKKNYQYYYFTTTFLLLQTTTINSTNIIVILPVLLWILLFTNYSSIVHNLPRTRWPRREPSSSQLRFWWSWLLTRSFGDRWREPSSSQLRFWWSWLLTRSFGDRSSSSTITTTRSATGMMKAHGVATECELSYVLVYTWVVSE